NPGSCSVYSTIKSTTAILRPAPPTISVPTTSSSGNYTVSWTSSSGATRYRLEEKGRTGRWTQIKHTEDLSEAIAGRASGTYGYRVRACSGLTTSTCGEYSDSDSIEVSVLPTVPVLLIHSATSTGDYIVSWNTISGATRYRLEEKVNS